MSGEVPEGWASATLGEVIRLEYGRALSASARDPGNIPVYGSNGVCGEHSLPLVPERGIVVGRKGTAGSVTVTTGPFWPIDTTYYVVPRIDVDFDWLAATLEHARLHELNESTGVPSLNRDKAYLQSILLPPPDEQRRISELLRSVDEAASLAAEAADQNRALWEALVDDLIWRPTLENDTLLEPLGHSIKASDYGVNAPLHDHPSGIAVLRMGNIQQGQIDLTKLKWGEIAETEATALKLCDGDILFNRTNSRDLVGKVALVRGEPGRIVDYIGVTQNLEDALASYRAEDVQNAMRDLEVLRRDLRQTHAGFIRQKRLMGLIGMDEKAAAYAVEALVSGGQEDDWFELQRLGRHFVKTYADLSPDPAILDFTADMKWAALFLRVAQQAITKDESLDHLSYSGKIREMLAEHVRATGLFTTVRLRNITDPEFKDDFDTAEKSEEELQEAFVRKAAELKRVTRELVDKNPAQYGRFSERVLEIIRRFEEGQIASAEGLKDFEDLTGGINAEQGAHDELGMSERAFAVLRIMEQHAADADHGTLQAAAMAVDAVYADAQRAQPLWFSMDGLRKTLRQTVRRLVVEHDLPEAKAIRDAVEDYAVHAYAAHH